MLPVFTATGHLGLLPGYCTRVSLPILSATPVLQSLSVPWILALTELVDYCMTFLGKSWYSTLTVSPHFLLGSYVRQYFVEMYFRNDTTREPYQLRLPGCTFSCPLAKFTQLVSPVIVENWTKACENEANPRGNLFYMLLWCTNICCISAVKVGHSLKFLVQNRRLNCPSSHARKQEWRRKWFSLMKNNWGPKRLPNPRYTSPWSYLAKIQGQLGHISESSILLRYVVRRS